jgi:LysE type translocator
MNSPVVLGFLASFALIAAIGAQNAFVLRQGIRGEHILPVVTVCTLSDTVLITAGIAGIGALIGAHPAALSVARFGGAAFLVGYGLLAAKRAWKPASLTPSDAAPRPFGRSAGHLRSVDLPQSARVPRHRGPPRRAGQRAPRRTLAVRCRRDHRQRSLVRLSRIRCPQTGETLRDTTRLAPARLPHRRDNDRPGRLARGVLISSYVDHYSNLFEHLVRERLYDAACLISSVKGEGIYGEPVREVSTQNLTAAIAGRVAYNRGLA